MKKVILILLIFGLVKPVESFFHSTLKRILGSAVCLGATVIVTKQNQKIDAMQAQIDLLKIKNEEMKNGIIAEIEALTVEIEEAVVDERDELNDEIDGLRNKIYELEYAIKDEKTAVAEFKYAQCPLVKKQDPRFYDFCEKIKRRSKIEEDVTFKFFSEDLFPEYDNTRAFYRSSDKSIYIKKEFYEKDFSQTGSTLAHECEHFRQDNKYSGSYHGSDVKLKEIGADAAAAGLIECYSCLFNVVDNAQVEPSKEGYFCKDDYLPYQERLAEDPKACKGCVKKALDCNSDWSDYLLLFGSIIVN